MIDGILQAPLTPGLGLRTLLAVFFSDDFVCVL